MAFGDFTVTRASTKLRIGSNGLYGSVANNVPAFEFNTNGSYRGLLVEPGATNLALNSRNLTTASWTATNVTTAQTATGADGGANSATTLTASAGNGTVLQAITSASASRVFSAVVRRRTGTGVVEITQDNGSTWTAITLTSSFQRFTTPNQTLTNPTVGFRIVTSGDAIDVDFCQAETGSVATSPIVTTAGTASRVADVVSLTGASSLIGQTSGAMYVEVEPRINAVSRLFLAVTSDPDVAGSRLRLGITSANALYGQVGGTITTTVTGTATITKMLLNYSASGFTVHTNGTSYGTEVTATTGTKPLIELGHVGSAAQANGWIRSVAFFPSALTTAQANSLTTL
jgi:hypothetical protein